MGFFLQVQEPFKGICCNAFAFINACIQATSFPTFKFDGKAASQVILLSTNTFRVLEAWGFIFQAIQTLPDDARLRSRCTFLNF